MGIFTDPDGKDQHGSARVGLVQMDGDVGIAMYYACVYNHCRRRSCEWRLSRTSRVGEKKFDFISIVMVLSAFPGFCGGCKRGVT